MATREEMEIAGRKGGWKSGAQSVYEELRGAVEWI
jgi:hypothetical protein